MLGAIHAKARVFIVMLSVLMRNVVILSVVFYNVLLSVICCVSFSHAAVHFSVMLSVLMLMLRVIILMLSFIYHAPCDFLLC